MKTKTRIILIALFCMCTFLCACKNDGVDTETKPVISKLLTYHPDGSLAAEIVYDKHGNDIKTTLTDADGKTTLVSEVTYKYDENGNYIVRTYKSDKMSYEEKITYEYDNDGNITSRKGEKDGQDMGEYTYVDGMLMKHVTPEEVCEYEYDKDGNVVKETIVNESTETVVEYYYDEQNYATGYQMTSQREDDTAVVNVVYENEYDEEGRLVKRSTYNEVDGEKVLVNSEEREYHK